MCLVNKINYRFEDNVLHIVLVSVQNSPYLKRRQFGQGYRKIRRKAGMSVTGGLMGVELVFAGLVMIERFEFCL